MDLELQKYLDTINKYLKPMKEEERVDILEEIKTNIIDMKSNENLTNEQIINRLGEPKQLARLYLGQNLKNSKYKKVDIIKLFSFNNVLGISNLIIIYSLAVCGFIFQIIRAIVNIAFVLKIGGKILGFDTSYINFGFNETNLFFNIILVIIYNIILIIIVELFSSIIAKYINMLIIKR